VGIGRSILGLAGLIRKAQCSTAYLYLSMHTVQRHVANIYAKIGVRNRAEATAYILHISAEI